MNEISYLQFRSGYGAVINTFKSVNGEVYESKCHQRDMEVFRRGVLYAQITLSNTGIESLSNGAFWTER